MVTPIAEIITADGQGLRRNCLSGETATSSVLRVGRPTTVVLRGAGAVVSGGRSRRIAVSGLALPASG